MKNKIKISIDGKSFTLVGDETEVHMRAVATYIDEKIMEIRKNAVAVKMDTSLAYVLAALNVADDYFKEKEKNAELEGRNLGLSTRLEHLIPQMDETKAELEEVKGQLDELKEKLAQGEQQAAEAAGLKEEEQTSQQEKNLVAEGKPEEDNHNQEPQPQHYPMGLKGGQAEKAMTRKAIRERYRKK